MLSLLLLKVTKKVASPQADLTASSNWLIYRRDKEFCDECRYCCTLSMCTTEKGTIYLRSKKSLEDIQEDENGYEPSGPPDAIFGYSTDMSMYKSNDFRCLMHASGVSLPLVRANSDPVSVVD